VKNSFWWVGARTGNPASPLCRLDDERRKNNGESSSVKVCAMCHIFYILKRKLNYNICLIIIRSYWNESVLNMTMNNPIILLHVELGSTKEFCNLNTYIAIHFYMMHI